MSLLMQELTSIFRVLKLRHRAEYSVIVIKGLSGVYVCVNCNINSCFFKQRHGISPHYVSGFSGLDIDSWASGTRLVFLEKNTYVEKMGKGWPLEWQALWSAIFGKRHFFSLWPAGHGMCLLRDYGSPGGQVLRLLLRVQPGRDAW